MKVLIIGFFSRTYMPYMKRYEKVLKEKNFQYDIIEFDRDCTGKTVKENNSYLFRHKTSTNKLEMLWLSLKYRKLILKVMKKNNYDKIILLTTMPAMLIHNKLIKKYPNKYIFDYRDYTYEKIPLYRKIVDKIIKNSYCTLMSSKGYMNFFENKDKIIITHNISNEEHKEDIVNDLKEKQNINIGFLGYIRYFDVNSKLIETFKNNSKFRFTYIGSSFKDCNLEEFCIKNNIKNVKFMGKYENSEKAKLYKDIDIINSIYSLNSEEVQPAIPNRLYDAALFKKPIITAKGTYLAKIVEEYELGFTIDVYKDNIYEMLNDYINNFNAQEFAIKCNRFLEEVYQDEKKCDEYVKKFICD